MDCGRGDGAVGQRSTNATRRIRTRDPEEDAKLFHKDIYALIVDLTSAFNTTDHDRMLWIMYDLGFQTDAIDAVKNLYENATTQVKLPSGVCTGQIPVERGTIQGDTLFPFLLLLYMEPLLRWLHVGGRGYVHTCIPKKTSSRRIWPTTSAAPPLQMTSPLPHG